MYFILSFQVLLFKEHIKGEIFIFIDQIFLKLLESGNSPYEHRYLALQVFSQIFKTSKIIFEFYVNYDCDVASENLFEKITESLSRIAQGKYSKSTFTVGIQPAQDLALRTIALETLVDFLKLISRTIEDTEFESEENGNKDETMKEGIEDEMGKKENQEKYIYVLIFGTVSLILLFKYREEQKHEIRFTNSNTKIQFKTEKRC